MKDEREQPLIVKFLMDVLMHVDNAMDEYCPYCASWGKCHPKCIWTELMVRIRSTTDASK